MGTLQREVGFNAVPAAPAVGPRGRAAMVMHCPDCLNNAAFTWGGPRFLAGDWRGTVRSRAGHGPVTRGWAARVGRRSCRFYRLPQPTSHRLVRHRCARPHWRIPGLHRPSCMSFGSNVAIPGTYSAKRHLRAHIDSLKAVKAIRSNRHDPVKTIRDRILSWNARPPIALRPPRA